MRKTIPALLVISTLVALVLCSACVGDQKPQQDQGLTQVSMPVETPRISFEEARQQLKDYQTDSVDGSVNVKTIYYILAKDLDDSGNAKSWVFGVNYGEGARMLIYDMSGWTAFPNSNTMLPSDEIVVDHIVSPNYVIIGNS